jgi:DNA-binding response OmpR family regulator
VPHEIQSKLKAHRRKRRTIRVLTVDCDGRTAAAIAAATCEHRTHRIVVEQADSIGQARQQLGAVQFDLMIIEPALANGAGMQLIRDVTQSARPVQTLVTTSKATFAQALMAMRAGAVDLIAKPINTTELAERINSAIDRGENELRREARVRRLRRACRKLEAAREEVTQQVDILCNDLVAAYQELADQMNHVVETSEYAALLRRELDLERMLHQTLEFVLEKVGPTNAAIFLPVTMDEFTLGGYVNYDCAEGSPEILLNHLADVVAPRAAELHEHVHLTDNAALADWLGDDAAYLADSHMLAFPCWTENEVLAVMTLFRDGSEPFDDDHVARCAAIAPMLAQFLAKIVRVHHRHIHD